MSSLLSGLVQRIINRYLQKWLKNVTTEHATIWGGEMVFKNVELRLDVLQEELGLPLVFTRGFIQELRVYIPLASLLRESIKFTLTNLEVVASTPTQTSVRAKTRANKGAGHRNSKMSPGHGPTPRGRAHIEEGDKENQPSWMHSVVQRVLQNIGVEVRNLVFKYNTDSYVSSVSWKSLSLTSSNSSWEPIFASPEGETRAIYKKLSVDDITWCLDAVDPSGKTSYQTPLFNRETLAVRTIIRLLPEGDVSQHEPYQLPALQIDVLVPHLLVTVSERQVKMLGMLVSELALMFSTIAAVKKDRDSALTAVGSGAGGTERDAKGRISAGLADPGSGNSIEGIRGTVVPLNLAPASLEGIQHGGAEEEVGVDDEKSAGGWLSYFWEFEGEEDELEEGDEVLEEGDTGRDRRKSASTSVAAALAIPYIGLVFRCSSSCAERGGGKERALPVSDGAVLDIAGSGVTLLFRQMEVGSGRDGEGAGADLRGWEEERETERGRETERQAIHDVRACLVGLSAHVHPSGGCDAENVISVGGLLSGVCRKRQIDNSRAHAAKVAPDGKGLGVRGQPGWAESMWAGLPPPRAFTGALSLFEQEQGHMVRNSSKDRWLWRSGGQDSNHPMSEGARSRALEHLFNSPLTYASLSGKSTAEGAQQVHHGGRLMDALMGHEGSDIAASLLRRAQGDVVSLMLPEDPDFNDGWTHSENVAILVSLSLQKLVPTSDKDNGDRGGVSIDDMSPEVNAARRHEGVYVKCHVQPLRVRLSTSALMCCNALALNFRPQTCVQTSSKMPVSGDEACGSDRDLAAKTALFASPTSSLPPSPYVKPGSPRRVGRAQGQALQRVSLDVRVASIDVVYLVEQALFGIECGDKSRGQMFSQDVHLKGALKRGGVVPTGAGGSAPLDGASLDDVRIPCIIFSVGQCIMRNCRGPPGEVCRITGEIGKGDRMSPPASVLSAETMDMLDDDTKVLLREYSGEVKTVQIFLSNIQAGTRVLGQMHALLQGPPAISLTAQHVLERALGGDEKTGRLKLKDCQGWDLAGGIVCWRMMAECKSVVAVLKLQHLALLDHLLHCNHLSTAVREETNSGHHGRNAPSVSWSSSSVGVGGDGYWSGSWNSGTQGNQARSMASLDSSWVEDGYAGDAINLVLGRCTADLRTKGRGRLALKACASSFQTQGLGLDFAWGKNVANEFDHRNESAGADALLVEFQWAKDVGRDTGIRVGGDCAEKDVGLGVEMSMADEMQYVKGMLKSLFKLGEANSRLRVTVGGGEVFFSASSSLPIVHALLRSRREAGMHVGCRFPSSSSPSATETRQSCTTIIPGYQQQSSPRPSNQVHDLAAATYVPEVMGEAAKCSQNVSVAAAAPTNNKMRRGQDRGEACEDADESASASADAIIHNLQMQNEWLQQRVGLLEKRAAHTGENIGLVSDEAFLGRHGSQPILPFNYHPNHSGFTSSLHASTTSCGHATCILVEASGIRRLMHKIRRVLNVGWGGKRTSVMSLPDFRRPWPVVLWLFAYASALHMIIAYLLHQMASSGTSLGHFW